MQTGFARAALIKSNSPVCHWLRACETRVRLRIDLSGRPSLRAKPGDLILNRQTEQSQFASPKNHACRL